MNADDDKQSQVEFDPVPGGGYDPVEAEEPVEISGGTLSIFGGFGLTTWGMGEACLNTEKENEVKLKLSPDRPIVIGRQEGGETPYLDPAFQPTQILPDSGHRVVASKYGPMDRCVSRGHFMLKASARGILLVNGVPRRGGGLRPPLNGTNLLAPLTRPLEQGEEYLIEKGTRAKFSLPNGTVILIGAE